MPENDSKLSEKWDGHFKCTEIVSPYMALDNHF